MVITYILGLQCKNPDTWACVRKMQPYSFSSGIFLTGANVEIACL